MINAVSSPIEEVFSSTILIPPYQTTNPKVSDENISAKIRKFNLIGIPYQLILGNKTEGDLFEFKEINGETQRLNIEDAASQILKAKSN